MSAWLKQALKETGLGVKVKKNYIYLATLRKRALKRKYAADKIDCERGDGYLLVCCKVTIPYRAKL